MQQPCALAVLPAYPTELVVVSVLTRLPQFYLRLAQALEEESLCTIPTDQEKTEAACACRLAFPAFPASRLGAALHFSVQLHSHLANLSRAWHGH